MNALAKKNCDLDVLSLKHRKSFGRVKGAIALPNLIKIQKESYNRFLYNKSFSELVYNSHKNVALDGIDSIFLSMFPIYNSEGSACIEYLSSVLEKPKYNVEESLKRGVTYSAFLKTVVRLIIWDIDKETGSKEIKNIKEQEVYVADLPLMTDKGTFIINGTERVVVSQLHRSPGIFFEHDRAKSNTYNKLIYTAKVIPYRGAWLDFEFDSKDILFFRLDKRRKQYVTYLFKALGLSSKEILNVFYGVTTFTKCKDGWSAILDLKKLKGKSITYDLVEKKTMKIVVKNGTKISQSIINKLEKKSINTFFFSHNDLNEKVVCNNVCDPNTGEVLLKELEKLTVDFLELIHRESDITLDLLDCYFYENDRCIFNTLLLDKTNTKEEALAEIYKVIQPGEPASEDVANTFFSRLFFSPDKYNLSEVGRLKINNRLNLNIDSSVTTLTKEDILEIVKYLIFLKSNNLPSDDIDNLSNRRVRSVGELIANQFRIGLVRMLRVVQDRMNIIDVDNVMPNDLINQRSLNLSIKEFFTTSQLSQFMDQTNPLSEVTHKRRLSALGPGGLSRDRAGFEVRDVHPTHYGRICPIETPEGANIGLINSLASYALVNHYGFIETPYRKVDNGKVLKEVYYLSAEEEEKYVIAQANTKLNQKTRMIQTDLVSSRYKGDYIMAVADKVDYIDVSPKQIVSVAASLIPFLENDDANRALMGSNMQRQAVPLIKNVAPIVGTGMERVVAMDAGSCVIAKRSGEVVKVNNRLVIIRVDESELENEDEFNAQGELLDIYELIKYSKSNQDTCINQKALVNIGDFVEKGDIVADGTSTDKGELALGANILVGFLSWNGYNFEDSILISEKLVQDEVFTSIHVKEFEVVTRDTRLGAEEITRDIPNVTEGLLNNLDESGIIHIGAKVKEGDIIVGKVTPKSESPATPEEKLLGAIFGDKATEVKDSSLYMPPGLRGTIVDVRVFTKRGFEKNERCLSIERLKIKELSEHKVNSLKIIANYSKENLKNLFIGEKLEKQGASTIKIGNKIALADLENLPLSQLLKIVVKTESIMEKVNKIINSYNNFEKKLEKEFEEKVVTIKSGDDLPQGVLQVIKVFVAVKRRLQVGDKMAGRHGNKGVVSKIIPLENMPYLEDGTPLDMVLNPLGVPSRMNIGQVMETHLGSAAYNLGKKIEKMLEEHREKQLELENVKAFVQDIYAGEDDICDRIKTLSDDDFLTFSQELTEGVPVATPVFDGARESDINEFLKKADIDISGQSKLYDGNTGEEFYRNVTVGNLYMLKLHHLVDEKMHARSIGPYSLVTQQPLGGKSHFGGQRFGEMECWGLQAYGAAYTLQEMLTVKSDDVMGRIKLYETIVKNDSGFVYGIPESFNVIVKELRSLCLNIEIE